jgi:AmmeMemoRadiSam system protein A
MSSTEPPVARLDEHEKRRLRSFARDRIRAAVRSEPAPPFGPASGALRRQCGVFVTLTRDSKLRGCIGMTTSDAPVWESVGDMAVSSALHDPRFPPVSPEEVEDLEIEISLLSPARTVESLDEIRVGTDGLLLRKGNASGFFLPKVAAERGWDRRRLLENLAVKAGLGPSDWQGGDLFAFEAEVF